MSAQEIFKNSKEVSKYSNDWKEVYAQVQALLQTNKVRCIRSGNTFYIYEIKSPGVANMFFVNADPVRTFIRNTEEALKGIKVAGFKQITGQTDDMPTIQALQTVAQKYGHKITFEQTGEDGIYKVTLNV